MIYGFFKEAVLGILQCPQAPPEPPVGSHDSVQIFRASPSHLAYRLLVLWVNLLLFALVEFWAIVVSVIKMGLPGLVVALGILLFAVGAGIILYVATRLDYEMRFYIITDRSLRIREGVWTISETTLTFENIQNMRIDQGPLQRLFGIYDLVVETAGGSDKPPTEGRRADVTHRGVIRGVKKPEQLRDLILAYLRVVRTSGLGDHDDKHPFPAEPAGTMPGSDFGAAETAALRAIADEVRAWRRSVEGLAQR